MQTVTVPIIRTEADFVEACDRLATIMSAPSGTAEADEAETLAIILDDYQRRHHEPLPDSTPLQVVRFVMEERGLKAVDLIDVFGNAARASDFLNGRRELSKSQMKRLHESLGIPYACLI